VAVLPDSAREVLESDGLAHLVTLNPDGSPQVTCVWIGLEGDEIVCAHLGRFQKVKNIERDPRVTLSVEAPGENEIGMKHSSTGRHESPRAAPLSSCRSSRRRTSGPV